MKAALLLLLIPTIVWPKSVVLVSYFDAFAGAPFNNSGQVAKQLKDRFKDHPEIDLRLCELHTVFDVSMGQFEECYKKIETEPRLVLGLGEADCNLKAEIMGRNRDHTLYPDNEGNEKNNTPIYPEGPSEVGFNYPLKDMYCSLSQWQRSQLKISNHAGSFICNNVAYQFSYKYPQAVYGFIHVPANNCRSLFLTRTSVQNMLELMIMAAIKQEEYPHRFPTRALDFAQLRSENQSSKCEIEFYKKTRGADE
jgi:pyrrolidone-carboxylate peptidase